MRSVDGIKPKKNEDEENRKAKEFQKEFSDLFKHEDFEKQEQLGKEDEGFKFDENEIFSEVIASEKLSQAHDDFLENIELKKEKVKSKFKNFSFFNFIDKNLKINFKFSHKSILASILILAIMIFSLMGVNSAKADTEKLSKEAQDHLLRSFEYMNEGDFNDSMDEASLALEKITKIKLLAQSWGQDIKYLRYSPVNNSDLIAQEKLLECSKILLDTFSIINKDFQNTLQDAVKVNTSTNDIPQMDFLDILPALKDKLDYSEKRIVYVEKELKELGKTGYLDTLPDNGKITTALTKAGEFIDSSKVLVNESLPWVVGADNQERKIMILFQNNTELRGSGGFIGSFAIADFKNGKLDNIKFETNIYNLDKKLTKKITPPKELGYFTNGWYLRDSNFAIDFSESMDKVQDFYALETGETVDGVIALDTTLFTDLLEAIGPIEMPEYHKTITEENFLKDIQYEVEVGYFARDGNKEENEPKKILADMMPKFINKLFSSLKEEDKALNIINSLQNGLNKKHLMFYFPKNSNLQRFIENKNYGGRVKKTIYDYLYVHNTNLGGMKSSQSIKEDIVHSVDINKDGEITSSLRIKRKHEGTDAWPDGTNNNLVRVLLPQNSKIVSFSPLAGNFNPLSQEKFSENNYYFESEEADKSKISFWQNTKPGQTSESHMKYNNKYSVDTGGSSFSYTILVQKQPGARPENFSLEINYPKGFEPINVKYYDKKKRKIKLDFLLDRDKTIRIKFEK